MKTGVISDIHGNYPALRAVLEDAEKEGVSQFYCLGDLVGYYCMFNEVVETLRNRAIPCLVGNHDFALTRNNGVIERSKTCTRILGRQLTEIKPENRAWLETLSTSFSFSMAGKNIFCVHGGLQDPVDEYIRNIDKSYFEQNAFTADVLISGHTHLPRNEEYPPYRYLNPGAVGQPRDGNPAASYLILDEGHYYHKRVNYDIDEIAAAMRDSGYDSYIYEILYRGVKVGG